MNACKVTGEWGDVFWSRTKGFSMNAVDIQAIEEVFPESTGFYFIVFRSKVRFVELNPLNWQSHPLVESVKLKPEPGPSVELTIAKWPHPFVE
jgi:hypothetical protein